MIAIRAYTLDEFESYLRQYLGAPIWATVLHHTYRPRGQDYRGLSTIEGIRRYHVHSRGWRDIGANAYAAPDGNVYNARPLNYSNFAHAYINKPFSKLPGDLQELVGENRQWLNRHAFGIETIGDFDREDPTDSVAMSTALDVLAMVHRLWALPPERLFFHRDVAYKTCPGKRVTHEWARAQLAQRLDGTEVVRLIEHGTGSIVAAVRMVRGGDHVRDQHKLYIERPEWARGGNPE